MINVSPTQKKKETNEKKKRKRKQNGKQLQSYKKQQVKQVLMILSEPFRRVFTFQAVICFTCQKDTEKNNS